ncbi:MAG: iron-sulfur cluster assembly protein [Candidatus Marinimicrobia bacterium]|nr:iron-sulfur cluster assembly protein [Candidatus Neomarinimicrobiota bacterium]MCF7851266.1 iron-sulfur cluster assembly protein [Candidatus Neomarinimicrobiota bacterium]MCF7905505.1 iron-sulfur cluster assembly protein [Candidatus Neomarinimicrobiota bacterium]
MASRDDIFNALKKVYDPEIPVNLVDLGLIYDVSVENKDVSVEMTLTAVGCPMHSVITQNVKDAIEKLDGVRQANVRIVWEPRWTPDRISEAGRTTLGMV